MYRFTDITVVKRNDRRKESFKKNKLLRNWDEIASLSIREFLPQMVHQFKDNLRRDSIKKITTAEISNRSGKFLMHYQMNHPDFAKLAQKVELNSLYKSTLPSFIDVMTKLHDAQDPITKKPIISEDLWIAISIFGEQIDQELKHENDKKYNYFALKILQESYLLKIDGQVVERPQHMLMRVALAAWSGSKNDAFEAYNSLSNHYFVPSHLMLQNAGLPNRQYQTSVAFLMEHNLSGLLTALRRLGSYTKLPADVGIGISSLIGNGSVMPNLRKRSEGVKGLLPKFHSTYGSFQGFKPGPVALYLEIWHKDIEDFLKFTPVPNFSYNVVVPGIFMKRLMSCSIWSLMCPTKCQKLLDASGDIFDWYYERYEAQERFDKRMNSSHLWKIVLELQKKTGYPNIVFKDNTNSLIFRSLLGPINTSNKYANFSMFSSKWACASAHTAFLILPEFIENRTFNYQKLEQQVMVVTKFINQIIDRCDYATTDLMDYNKLYRPMAIGVHGLADLFQKLNITFNGEAAKNYNHQIFEVIYLTALETLGGLAASHVLASKLELDATEKTRFDLPRHYDLIKQRWPKCHIDFWKWGIRLLRPTLRDIREPLLVSLKSDKITAQIMGVSNSTDPLFTNVYTVNAFELLGDNFTIINEHLMRYLLRCGLWNLNLRDQIIDHHNSLMTTTLVDFDNKDVYQTAPEMEMSSLIEMAVSRAPFVDQSQSTKLYLKAPTVDDADQSPRNLKKLCELSKCQILAWKSGLKTLYKVVPFVKLPPCMVLTKSVNQTHVEDPPLRHLYPTIHV